MEYRELLERSFVSNQGLAGRPEVSRVEYLANEIFNFTTYDGSMDELFGTKALEVCRAITERTTFDYIKDEDNYVWFLSMCNMPFFEDRLSWGTSIRGAWWDCYPAQSYFLESCGLWDEKGEQILEIEIPRDRWDDFVRAMLEFATLPHPPEASET